MVAALIGGARKPAEVPGGVFIIVGGDPQGATFGLVGPGRMWGESGMTRIAQHLRFERDMEAAIRFCTSLIPGSEVSWISTVPAGTPSGPAGSVRVAAFTPGDQRYRAVEAGPLDPFNHGFSVVVERDDQAGVDRLWDALLEGGTPERCGWLRDRWGQCWQIAPKRLGELMGDPDREEARRVAEAMLGMVKLDIAALEAAARAGPS